MVRNLGGQPRRARIFHSPSRLTISKALVRSTNLPRHLPGICLDTKIMFTPPPLPFGPEPTVAFWRVFLCYRRDEPIQLDASQHFACTGEQSDVSIV